MLLIVWGRGKAGERQRFSKTKVNKSGDVCWRLRGSEEEPRKNKTADGC